MNTIVTANIDVATPTGRRIIKELEQHKRTAKSNHPILDNIIEKTYTVDEVYNECCDILSDYYGCDVRTLNDEKIFN
ncbi:hypothetical protein FACS189437_06280 [Bacteroidia bacterium]|nr:hypothetical protein FACS189437_06280 [Bacteroidia bacterium]